MNSLSFRISKGTSVHLWDNCVQLVLRYPLKTITIHSAWRLIFEQLAGSSFVLLTDLEKFQVGIPRGKIVDFLNQLVLKGFLEREGIDTPDYYPSFSIIIPVRNRPSEISDCLTSLLQLDYPDKKIEIIVVDDASEDETPEEVEKYPVHLIRLKHNMQASYCRNLGARAAKGEILAFVDSDCIADPMWLKQLLPAFDDPVLAAVGGRVDAYYESKRLDLYEKSKSPLIVSSYAKRSGPDDPFFYVPACNFLARRHVFLEVGGFNTHLSVGEDVDLCWRLQKHYHDFEFRPEGIVYHKHRNRLSAFCKRRFEYGTSEPLLQKIHPDKVKKILVPPAAASFWVLLILGALTRQPLFGGIGCLVAIAHSLFKHRRYKRLDIGLGMIFSATLRSYTAFVYHICAFVSRYYLILGILFAPLSLTVTLIAGSMHILNGIVEYRLKRASLNFACFFGFFTLEQMSYQAGVWLGCLRNRLLSPISPRFITNISSR